jgi:hypothetical protein
MTARCYLQYKNMVEGQDGKLMKYILTYQLRENSSLYLEVYGTTAITGILKTFRKSAGRAGIQKNEAICKEFSEGEPSG